MESENSVPPEEESTTENDSSQQDKEKEPDKQTSSSNDIFQNIYGGIVESDDKFSQGIANLNLLLSFFRDLPPPPINGKEFVRGVMGFRRKDSNNLELAIACGKAQVRYIPLAKFIAMIENLHDPKSATILLQNFQYQYDYRSAKGQILGKIHEKSSAIIIFQGIAGRVIRRQADVALIDVYYLDRSDLTSFYLAAKAQIRNADKLENMITTYDGWKEFNIPLLGFK